MSTYDVAASPAGAAGHPRGEGHESAADKLNDLPPIAWTETFAIGDEAIDAQHRHFIGQVNRLAICAAAGGSQDTVADLLAVIAAVARDHFASEERAFTRLGFTGAEAHVAEHRRLERQMDELLTLVRAAPGAASARRAAMSMRELLLNHLVYYDLRYKSLSLHKAGLRDAV